MPKPTIPLALAAVRPALMALLLGVLSAAVVTLVGTSAAQAQGTASPGAAPGSPGAAATSPSGSPSGTASPSAGSGDTSSPNAAANDWPSSGNPGESEIARKLNELKWVRGPTNVPVGANSTLAVPAGYVFLDAANTAKFEELSQNLSSGKEVMIAPRNLQWSAYLVFDSEGYVKDDEKIDAPALLKSLQEQTQSANEERRRRGWEPFQLTGWSIEPAYNKTTKRLEWATHLQGDSGESTNFFTKILGRRGVTSVVLATRPDNTRAAVADLDQVLSGYKFNTGESYSEWRPGDKVAEYGLAGLIVGGAAAVAAKTGLFKGLFKFIIAGAAAMWKVIIAGIAALTAGVRSFFRRKSSKG